MQVLAPKSGYIAAVAAREGDNVQAGFVVAQMDTTANELLLTRLASIDALREIYAKRLRSPAIDLARRLAQIAIDIARIQQTDAATAGAKANVVASLSGEHRMERFDYKLASDLAPLQRETAEKNLALFEYLIAEVNSINTLIKAHVQTEATAATALRDSLSFKALNSGVVHLSVQAGWFVHKGEVVFEIA